MVTPLFSIVIPTWNRATILPTALRSVLAQTDRDFELIVVDDGSTDDTRDVVGGFDDDRIRYVSQRKSGVSVARNAGAAQARGEFLVFLDSDDELLADALQRMREEIEAHGWDAVLGGRILVSPDRRRWRTLLPEELGFIPGAFAVRLDLFRAAGGYDPELRYAENTEFGWRVRRLIEERDGRIGVATGAFVVVYARASRGYELAKYEAARYLLDHDAKILDSEVAGRHSPRQRRSTYQAIAAVNGARIGKRGASIALALSAVVNDPLTGARYRNVLSVVRSGFARSANGPRGDVPQQPLEAVRSSGVVHGVVVTYARPESLERMIDEFAVDGLASLTIVDNAPSVESKAVADRASDRMVADYLPMTENLGPAGGYAAGMAHVLERATDDDWILIVDDDGVTGSPETAEQLRDFGVWLLERGAPVGAVGLVGARFDRRFGRLVRPRDEELAGPVTVDYIAGGQMLMLRVGAVRRVGTFDARLFFGFDDLDYCLRLGRAGYGVYAHGPAWFEARRRFDRLGPTIGRSERRESVWRRYYSVRNHILMMRRYASWPRALLLTAVHLFVRPLVDLRNRRASLRYVVVGTRGCIDAWTGKLGRRVEPSPGT